MSFDIKEGVLVGYEGEDTEVVVPDGVQTISDSAFAYSPVTSISIPGSVTKIERAAFSNTRQLKCIYLENYRCFLDEGLVWPSIIVDGVFTNNPPDIFINGVLAEEIEIPDDVTEIGEFAFNGWKKLRSVVISDNVKSIGKNAFTDCWNLKNIEIPNSIKEIKEYAFSNCTSLDSISIPDSVKLIERYAFQGCNSLKTIELPNKLKKIER